jgi:hypothetical protein
VDIFNAVWLGQSTERQKAPWYLFLGAFFDISLQLLGIFVSIIKEGLMEFTASVDKLVLVSRANNVALQDFAFNSLYTTRNYVLSDKYYYHRFVQFFDGSLMFLGRDYGCQLIINPNKCLYDDMVIHMLNLIEDARISRIDIALDYKHDLSRYVLFDKSGRRDVHPFRNNVNALKGVYFGRRKSNTTFLVYNKGLKEGNDEFLWRAEVRFRNPTIDNILPTDLFAPLCAGGVALFPPKDSHLQRLRRFPEHIKSLSKYRRNIARKLSMDSEDKLLFQPNVVFNHNRNKLLNILSDYILIPLTDENYP